MAKMNAEIVQACVTDADQTRAVGRALAPLVRAGDLIMLSGGLGAGKTTFTQGLGYGLGARGRVASPTFIVAREHPCESGLTLIHADAYRINDLDDLETLDLDATLDQSVTVIEWGEGKTESLSPDRLEIQIGRPQGGLADTGDGGGVVDLEQADDGARTLMLRPCSERWSVRELADAISATGVQTQILEAS